MHSFLFRPGTRLSAALAPACALLTALVALAVSPAALQASIAYGSINNFDTVNDTGQECHGFEIEIEDCQSTDITYTYDYNHYGTPRITQDDSVAGHPRTVIRWESRKNADGSWASYTAIPATTIAPTDGHQFTNPSVNFGGEHFGVGYSRPVGAIHYHWLVDNGSGTLVRGGVVQVSTPVFTYFPPVAAAPAQVQAVIAPPPPPAPEPKEFGRAVWMKEIKTTTHNSGAIRLRELVSDDPDDPNDKNWANGEPDEVEVEWRLLQKRNSLPDGGPNNEVAAAPEALPNGDEVVTRRYEFYKYVGPLDAETGEAMADLVAADGLHGSGTVTYADHFNNAIGEWVTITSDLSTFEIVGAYTGAQMAAVDVDAPVGLIDHVNDGEVGVPYAARSIVVEGALPFTATQGGTLPPGMTFDTTSGVLAGTPTTAGVYTFQVLASDGLNADVEKNYTLSVAAAGAELPATHLLDTTCLPAGAGSSTGDGSYTAGDTATVTATAAPGYEFLNWTENGTVVSSNRTCEVVMNVHHSLVANFRSNTPQWNISVNANPVEGGSVQGGGLVDAGLSTTVTASAHAGYVFSHWSEAGTLVSSSASYTFTAGADRSLVAHFTLSGGPLHVISTSASPSAGGTTSGAGSYASGSSVTVTATAAAGYKFSKWKENGVSVSSSASYTFTASANRSLVATFIEAYTVSLLTSPLNGGTAEADSTSYKLNENARVDAFPSAGYAFVQWTENGTVVSSANPYTFNVTGSRTLVAQFAKPGDLSINTSAEPADGGSISGSGSFASGTAVTLSAVPAAGYAFVRWTENGVEVGTRATYDFTALENRTLVAHFAAGSTVSTSSNPATGGNTTGGGFVATGGSATLVATANPGYTFLHWTDAAGTELSSQASYTFTPAADTACVAHFVAPPLGVGFNFDTATPSLVPGQSVPLAQTVAGITASFNTGTAGDFHVASATAGGRVLPGFSGLCLEAGVDNAVLTLELDTSATGVSLDFATVESAQVAVPSTLQLTAYDTSSGAAVLVGTAIAHGSAGGSLPAGSLNFNSGSGSFNLIQLRLPDAPVGALRFLIDNLLVSPGASTGGSLLLANPNWNITLTDFGYSDFLLDNTPGFEGREYLSGEWGSAVAYEINGQPRQPTWLEPNFIFPDWHTNSDFRVVEGIHVIGSNADGLPIARSVIANDDLEITQRFEMVDTVTGTPMGVKPASAAGAPQSVNSNRYVMNQAFTVKNISGQPLARLQLFHLLHGFISQQGQFDNRSYAGKWAEYRHDITLSGIDASAAGSQSSSLGLEDLIGFSSSRAPSAYEIGHYGIEGGGVDDHITGKPSDGVHLSMEDNWTHGPYLDRKNRDSFAPANRWLAGAQRWELGSLSPGQSISLDLLLSLLTGTKVVIDGNGTTGHGSCNGGAGHVGGVDFEFEDIDQEGTFYGEYAEADDDELAELEDAGEFVAPGFAAPTGSRHQRWDLAYNGAHTGNIRLKFAYNPALLPPGCDENQLAIYHFRGGVWEKLPGKVDPVHHTIATVSPSLSPFMLGLNDVVVKPEVNLASTEPGVLEVSWPDSFAGWILQENPGLDATGWVDSNRPVTRMDGTARVQVPLADGRRFFRLMRP